jgi:S-formylglutathione hydrolase FrmB
MRIPRAPAAVAAVSLVLVAASTAQASRLVTWVTPSRYVDVTKAQFNSPPPGDPKQTPALRVNVLLPDGYNGVRRFPVLFLLHGHGDTYQSWMNTQRGDLPALAPHFPAIVVMPEAAQGWYTNWWDGGARGSDGTGWENYFLDQLLPLVQQRLKILPGRSEHAIAGLSMGGEGAIYIAEQRPDYFGAAASFSGTLSIQRPEWPTGFGTQGQNYDDVYGPVGGFYATGHNPTALVGNLRYTRVFVRVGNGVAYPYYPGEATNYFGAVAESELSHHAQDFVSAAQQAGVAVHYEPTTGIHDWPWWRLAMASALKWGFFAPVTQTPSAWKFETVSQSGRAWDLCFRFASPPGTLETFTRSGSMLSATGSGTVRITPDRFRSFSAKLPFARRLVPLASKRHRRHRRHR